MRIKVPDSLQKEWLEKELEDCLDRRKVVNYFGEIYGSFEDLKSLGIINRWDIFDNPYAMRASYLKYLSDIRSLPKGICDTLISFNLQRLNWKIAVPPALPRNSCILELLNFFLRPPFNLCMPEVLIECIVGYAPKSEKALRLFTSYALRQETDPHFEKGRKSLVLRYANQISRVEGCNFFWEVPKRGSMSFLRKLKELYKRIQELGASTKFMGAEGFIYENDEEYLEEVLEGKYYLLWPAIFGSTDTFHICQLISMDVVTLRVLSEIVSRNPKSTKEILKYILETLLGYPLDFNPGVFIGSVIVYKKYYSSNFRGLPLLLLWEYLSPFHILPFTLDDYNLWDEEEVARQAREFLQIYNEWDFGLMSLNKLLVQIPTSPNPSEEDDDDDLYLSPLKWAECYNRWNTLQIRLEELRKDIIDESEEDERENELREEAIELFRGLRPDSDEDLWTPEDALHLTHACLRNSVITVNPHVHNGLVGHWFMQVNTRKSLHSIGDFLKFQELSKYCPQFSRLVSERVLTFQFVPKEDLKSFVHQNFLSFMPIQHFFKDLLSSVVDIKEYKHGVLDVRVFPFYYFFQAQRVLYPREFGKTTHEEILRILGVEVIKYDQMLGYLLNGCELRAPKSSKDVVESIWKEICPPEYQVLSLHTKNLKTLIRRYPHRTLQEYAEGIRYLHMYPSVAPLISGNSLLLFRHSMNFKNFPKFMSFKYPYKSINRLAIYLLSCPGFIADNIYHEELLDVLQNLPVDEANTYADFIQKQITLWGLSYTLLETFLGLMKIFLQTSPRRKPSEILKDLKILSTEKLFANTAIYLCQFIYMDFRQSRGNSIDVTSLYAQLKYLNKKGVATFWGMEFEKLHEDLVSVCTPHGPKSQIHNNLHDFVYAFKPLLRVSPWVRCFAPVYLWHKVTDQLVQFPQHPEDYKYREEWCFVDNPQYFREVYDKTKAFFLRDPNTKNPSLLYVDSESLQITECETWEGNQDPLDHDIILQRYSPLFDSSQYGVGLAPHYFHLLCLRFSKEIGKGDEGVMVDFEAKKISWSLAEAEFQVDMLIPRDFEEEFKNDLMYVIQGDSEISMFSWTGKGIKIDKESIRPRAIKQFEGGEWMTYRFLENKS